MTNNASRGPIEEQGWPERLTAHVVDCPAEPRLHGFDVYKDLARFYSSTEVTLIALTGEAPNAEQSRAFDIALTFVAPAFIADAPAHAACLARICGARTAGISAVAATALSEQSRALLDEHDVVLPRLVIGSLNGMAVKFAARSASEREAVQHLRDALGKFCSRVPSLGYDLRLDTAIIAVMLACGLRTRDQIEIAITTARLPVVCAEALAWQAGDLRAYPMDLPHFKYEETVHA